LPVSDNEKILIGNLTVECIHTPGHSPGGQCFYAAGNLLTGDTLFIDAIGRTDLPGGDTQQLFHSLQRIKKLPRSTEVWPGHNYGSSTHQNLSVLCQNNPYLACDSLEEFMELAG
jgi:glyoxylase-like metal-dependent hydrolase (beta-lactamase superfamily II)